MKTARMLYHLARADFLERVRRYSFLITLGLTVYLGYISVPPNHGTYVSLDVNGHRPLYNSAFVGTIVALEAVLFLTLCGFYVVRNALDRDLRTGVGKILATTPLTRPLYTLGKALSNFAVLAAMVAVVAVAAVAMQLIRREDTAIHFWALVSPFLFLVLPAMAVVASVAILFETISWLRGGLGNVIYFFVWVLGLSLPNLGEDALTHPRLADPVGISFALPGIASACQAAFPGCADGQDSVSLGFNFKGGGQLWDLTTYPWAGIHWTPVLVANRMAWLIVAAGLAIFAAWFFHRFDPAREKRRGKTLRNGAASAEREEPAKGASGPVMLPGHLTPLTRAPSAPGASLLRVANAELRLMRRGRRWWFIVAAGLFVASAVVPIPEVRQMIAAVAWFWPVLIWSQMGAREARNGTESLVFSSERALYRQLPGVWLAGVVVAMVTGGGYALRLLFDGDAHGLLAWLAAALFIPSLALALGVWSGSSKLFEVIYTLWWYVGPMSHAPGLNYLNPTSTLAGPVYYLAGAGALLAAAYLGRRTKLGYA